jgi:hypothetical protein
MKKVCFVTEKEEDLIKLIISILRREFKKIDIELIVACYSETKSFLEVIQKNCRDKEFLFFLGLNSFGSDLHIQDQNGKPALLWSKIQKPFFNLQADPCFTNEMISNVAKSYNRYRVDFALDPTNHYWLQEIKQSSKNIYGISTFGMYFDELVQKRFQSVLERPIQTLLCLSFCDPDFFYARFKQIIKNDDQIYIKTFENIVKTYLNDLRSDPILWTRTAFQQNSMVFDIHNTIHQRMLSEAWHYIRMQRRWILLNSLSEFPLHIITSGSISGARLLKKAKLHPKTTLNPPVSFSEYINFLALSKIHLSPPSHYFTHHERQPAAMFQGCVSISAPNVHFEERFAHGVDAFFYNDLQDNLKATMHRACSNEEEMLAISERARKSATDNYCPQKTIHTLMTVYSNLFEKN